MPGRLYRWFPLALALALSIAGGLTRLDAQTRVTLTDDTTLTTRLEAYARAHPEAARAVDISMVGTVQEFANAFSEATELNLTVAPEVDFSFSANFANTTPADILEHLVRLHEVDLVISGSIVSVVARAPRREPPAEAPLPSVDYDPFKSELKLDLRRDSLEAVIGLVSRLTGRNFVLTPAAESMVVSGFINKTTVDLALEQLAVRNGLDVFVPSGQEYTIVDVAGGGPPDPGSAEPANRGRGGSRRSDGDTATPAAGDGVLDRMRRARRSERAASAAGTQLAPGALQIDIRRDSLRGVTYDIQAKGVPLADVLREIESVGDFNYHLLDDPSEVVSVRGKSLPLETLLDMVLVSNDYGYRTVAGVYLVGKPGTDGLQATRVVLLEHRTARELARALPAEAVGSLSVFEFLELNALILHGSANGLDRLESVIRALDRTVPMVMIELLIVDVQKNIEVRTGVEVGLADEPVKAGGTVFPSVDLTVSSKGLNDVLDLLAGNGIVNIGQVNPNFYARIQAAETNGFAKVHSKPRLSTLNGVEADFSIGETRYFEIQTTTLQGAQNPIALQARNFQSVNADFTVRVLPVVSGDGTVTLEIAVDQSDFIGQISNDAPPAQVRRSFNSTIRVRDGDMVVLGGLSSDGVEDSGRGVPVLSRIPGLRWLFSSRRRANNDSELLIFVRPFIDYGL